MAEETSCERGPSINKTLEGVLRRSTTNPQRILDIAKSIQGFIDSNGWSWCDMDRVYRILKMVNG
jgi:hypothetical protein